MKKLLTYTLLLLAVVSCLQEERSPEEILVPSPAQVDCSEASFSLTSKVPNGSEKLVEECGFLVGTAKDFADAVTVEGTMTANAFAAELPMRKYGATYYICSYVTNGHGSEIRSDVRSFALESLDKYVKFGAVTVRSYDMASKTTELSLAADIWAGVEVSEAGLCYGESETLSLEGDYAAGSLANDGAISVTISGLVDGEKYYLRPYLRDGEYLTYGNVVEFSIPAVPVVKTADAAEVTSEGAVLSGEVVKGADISERGFMFAKGESSAADMKQKKVVEGTIGEYTLALEGLLPNQKYTYCAYAVNPTGTYYGLVKSFTTKVGLPVVASVVASSITSTSATLSATVKSHGGETVSEVGFYYSTDEAVDIETATKVNKPYSQDAFSIDVTDLAVNTKHYVKSYAKNSAGVAYSDVESFTTAVSSPSVKTVGFSEVTSASAVLTGLVVSDNGAAITERGFVWVKGSDTPTTDSNKLKVDGTTGEFTCTLDGLEPNQKFSFRAYAINSKGTSYGEIMNFSTVAGLPSLSATKVISISETSATFTCTVTDNGGATVSKVGFYYSTDAEVNLESAQKVEEDYSSDNFTISVDGLEVGTDYYVKAFVANSAGEVQNAIVPFKTVSAAPTVRTIKYEKVSATSVRLTGEVLDDNGERITDRGFVWDKAEDKVFPYKAQVLGETGEFSAVIEDLQPNQKYAFRAYATNSVDTSYGEILEFEIVVGLPTVKTAEVTDISDNGAVCGGSVTSDGGGEILEKGVVWSKQPNPTVDLATKTDEGEGTESFTSRLTDLSAGFTYYVRAYATNAVGTAYGEEKKFTTTGEIQSVALEAANSFIISSPDIYSFSTVKGNSTGSVGEVASAEVLWESYGTEEDITTGSLVAFASYANGKITFAAADNYREGNAVIAAKDASGKILWSWHIWMTDQPQEHIYPNNAGTMMDRNLGAISAEPGSVGALGLLYQWGRKDPFLGAGTMEGASPKSTGMWEAPAVSDASNGTIERAIEHPTQFIFSDEKNIDWQYIPDNTRWQSEKTMYDPCPVGWRVPDEGENGVWSTAGFSKTVYDGANEGMSFDITSPATTWYPAAGHLTNHGDPSFMNGNAYYWSVAIAGEYAYSLYFHSGGGVDSMFPAYRSCAFSVRCQKEGTGGGSQYDNDFSTSGATQLSTTGTANSYIVSGAGTYSIAAVMGNSYESVGSVDSAEVLWESFGTDEKVTKGDLVAGAKYEDGLIYFKTADWFREGNAVIAAKDASGTILWSWHIWLTDQPQEQIYYNNAGTMMDRNLGATSATPGDVGALGLLYQWGRKDPFLGSSSISYIDEAKSTINWPSVVASNPSTGTIDYALQYPTTFITFNGNNNDWHYTGSSSIDDTRWQSEKTIYDPCPVGWRVPDGGEDGVWSTAKGSSSTYNRSYDEANDGMNFSGDFGSSSIIWYPASGGHYGDANELIDVGYFGYYWSVTPYGNNACYLRFGENGYVYVLYSDSRADGRSVRCQKEGTGGGLKYDNDFSTSGAAYLSSAGTANSYMVSSAGTYRIDPVKGNSSESVGPVESAVVLWESYGTRDHYDYINKGNLIAGARYDGGNIYFKTADEFREGNAVIAAKDADGTILWSWHIWMTDRPEEHTYPNNAGVMMDRNLGATSAEPGAAGALGLLYQWGRKDPFLNSYAPNFPAQAPATINWPSAVTSSPSEGTIDYAVKNPTTYIYGADYGDWCYSTSAATDVTRWQSEKTKYDPCPVGWRVPDGGDNGIWNKAGFSNTSFSSANFGTLFSITYPTTTWYPASGHIYNRNFALGNVGASGYYWSATSIENHPSAYAFEINNKDEVNPDYGNDKSFGFSVRCFKEDSGAQPTIPGPDEYWASEIINLAVDGTANCYIVSESGAYGFPTVPGNLYSPVGQVASAEVLWESFGTDEKPSTGDLIKEVLAKGSMIYFKTSDTFREGNAVIAAKDPSGTILWSWHIWLTDQPEEQVYYNNAGTMMDRNLGATSATPGDVGALGLLYQWGRKDPFLGSSSISSSTEAKSTITWPEAVESHKYGTIEYSMANPTTFIKLNFDNYDWYYTGSSSIDDFRWQSEKTIYDPCPVGWRVPDGGNDGIWYAALGLGELICYNHDGTNNGIDLSGNLGADSTIWYPALGYRNNYNGTLDDVGSNGYYWSVTPNDQYVYLFYISNNFSSVYSSLEDNRSYGFGVRCQKE